MKEIKVKVFSEKTAYEAADGTVFDSKSECEKYEKSAVGVLLYKLKPCLVKTDVCFAPDDNDESLYNSYIPRKDEDIDAMNRLYAISTQLDKLKFSYDNKGDTILIGHQRDGEITYVWFYNLSEILRQCGS